MSVQGDGCRLDGDTPILFVLASIRKSSFTSFCGGDNTSALDKRVGKGGLAMVDYTGKTVNTLNLVAGGTITYHAQ